MLQLFRNILNFRYPEAQFDVVLRWLTQNREASTLKIFTTVVFKVKVVQIGLTKRDNLGYN